MCFWCIDVKHISNHNFSYPTSKPQGVELHYILNALRSFWLGELASLVDEEVSVPESSNEPVEVLHRTLTSTWLALLEKVTSRSQNCDRVIPLTLDR